MELIDLMQSVTLLGVFKVLIVTLLTVYALFAFLMMRQVVAMTNAVMMRDDYVIRIIGVINFVFAILVFLMSVLIL